MQNEKQQPKTQNIFSFTLLFFAFRFTFLIS